MKKLETQKTAKFANEGWGVQRRQKSTFNQVQSQKLVNTRPGLQTEGNQNLQLSKFLCHKWLSTPKTVRGEVCLVDENAGELV